MNPKVLVVEDNKDLLFGLETLLEINDFEVETALDGNKALKYLKNENKDQLPDIIISDIMMPKMDGYNFFKEVTVDERLSFIPFIFLTAKSTSDDIREGKLLGVDDYITKPFDEEDLLASIKGKIQRSQSNRKMARKIEKRILENLKIRNDLTLEKKDREEVKFLVVVWDEAWGPEIKAYYPKDNENKLVNIAVQLFNVTTAIYGKEKLKSSEDVLLKIETLDKYAYLLFDYLEDDEVRTGQRQFMLVVIAPNISYIKAREIKQHFNTIAEQVKAVDNVEDIDAEKYWKKMVECLAKPIIEEINL